jgi:hypothetical protein
MNPNQVISKQQFLKDGSGQLIGVFLTMDEYNALLEKNEELEDIILYLKAKLESGNEQPIPLREAVLLRKQNQTT